MTHVKLTTKVNQNSKKKQSDKIKVNSQNNLSILYVYYG